jgi:hypothetical protein
MQRQFVDREPSLAGLQRQLIAGVWIEAEGGFREDVGQARFQR